MFAQHPYRVITVRKGSRNLLLDAEGQVGIVANVRGFQATQEIVIHPGGVESRLP